MLTHDHKFFKRFFGTFVIVLETFYRLLVTSRTSDQDQREGVEQLKFIISLKGYFIGSLIYNLYIGHVG